VAAGKRVYRSPLRAEQAQRTRAAVLDAAARCFAAQGYAAATMKDVAAEAGVAVQTVFSQGSKASLLLACVDRAVTGDDEELALLDREPFVRLFESTDREEKLAAWRAISLAYSGRVVPVMKVFADAAGADPEIAAAFADYEERRYADVRAVVASFAPWLRDGLDVDRATEVLWAVLDHTTGDNLMRVRGWTVPQFADFVVETAERLLLGPPAVRRPARR
jgi:AcrR family transcriptional regulator